MSPAHTSENNFFEYTNKSSQYKKNVFSASGIGEKKFSFHATNSAIECYISFHVTPSDSGKRKKRVGYAFSMVNDFLAGFRNLPQKSDTIATVGQSFDSVPDHAYALSAKPSQSDIDKLLKKQEELKENIDYFEGLLTAIAGTSFFSLSDDLCKKSEYKVFCKDGSVKTNTYEFISAYQKYLNNKKDYMGITDLVFYEQELQLRLNRRSALAQLKDIVKESLGNIKTEIGKQKINEQWESLKKFDKDNFDFESTKHIVLGDPGEGYIAQLAGYESALDYYPKILTKLDHAISVSLPEETEKGKDCPPEPTHPRTLGDISSPGAHSNVPGNNCADIKKLTTPNTFEELAEMIPYWPKSSEFTPFGGKRTNKKTKINEVQGFRVAKFKYSCRINDGQISTKESPYLWACFTDVLQNAWELACEESNYYPFEITNGVRGTAAPLPLTQGTTAYPAGISLHSYGLAFDLDPYIAGFSNNPNRAVHSVYTGAWTPGFIEVHGKDLWKLGVYKHGSSILKNNAFQEENRPRMTENWRDAPSHYRGSGESGNARQKYIKIMDSAKGNIIVPGGANPTLWVIRFCELSGMRWGNAFFLKKRWSGHGRSGAKTWTKEEKDKISNIFGIENVVDRIQAISWKDNIEDHMHFHYWGGRSLIPWSETKRVREKVENK